MIGIELNLIKIANEAKMKLLKKIFLLSVSSSSKNLKKLYIDKIENMTAGISFPNSEILVYFSIR